MQMNRQYERSANWLAAKPIIVMAFLSASALALADPAPEDPSCPVAVEAEARSLADVLYEQGDFQHAAECYVTAGETERANRAFIKAVGPASEASERRVTGQGQQVKALLQRYKLALHLKH
jgi:hypothetical protein